MSFFDRMVFCEVAIFWQINGAAAFTLKIGLSSLASSVDYVGVHSILILSSSPLSICQVKLVVVARGILIPLIDTIDKWHNHWESRAVLAAEFNAAVFPLQTMHWRSINFKRDFNDYSATASSSSYFCRLFKRNENCARKGGIERRQKSKFAAAKISIFISM